MSVQAELTHMQSRVWENNAITEAEAQEIERQATLLKIKMVSVSDKAKQIGMETGLSRLETFQQHARRHADQTDMSPEEERQKHKKLLMWMLPVAFVFMFFVFGSSTVDFDDSRPISGHLFPLAAGHPVVWPMGSSEAMVEARIHIQSSAGPGGGGGGGHRRFSARGQRPSLLHSAQKHSPSVRRRKNPSENVRRLELDKPKKQHAGTRTPPKHPETRPAALAAHVIRGTVDRKILQTESVCGTPPQVPEPWQAVCDPEYSIHYYWNTTGTHVQWEIPGSDGSSSTTGANSAQDVTDKETVVTVPCDWLSKCNGNGFCTEVGTCFCQPEFRDRIAI